MLPRDRDRIVPERSREDGVCSGADQDYSKGGFPRSWNRVSVDDHHPASISHYLGEGRVRKRIAHAKSGWTPCDAEASPNFIEPSNRVEHPTGLIHPKVP